MTYNIDFMANFKKIEGLDVHLADNHVVRAVGMGDILMELQE